MAESSENPLLLAGPSDLNLQVALHPLVLLTISDQITRHHVRQESDVVVGALLGQIHGRSMTIEHAFPCNVIKDGQDAILHTDWFEERLKQYKDVHKQPTLDLIGWFAVIPESGPTIAHLPIHHQILAYSETPVLLAFHSSALGSESSIASGRLPLTLYETVEEAEAVGVSKNKDKDPTAMQIDGEDVPTLIKFRSIPYSVETEETEMIGIDYIAKGGGNAAAIDTPSSPEASPTSTKMGKRRSKQEDIGLNILSPEEQDLIATLNTRLNSIRMLQSRIGLLQKTLQTLPPSYLSETNVPLSTTAPSRESLPHIRQINSLVTRLSLLTPAPLISEEANAVPRTEFNLTAQSNDANLAALLSLLGKTVQGANELGRKFAAAESIRTSHKPGGKIGGRGGARFDFVGDQFAEPDFDVI